MVSRPVVLGLFGAVCVTAAAGGAFVALRQNASDRAAASAAVAAPAASPASPARPVAESEGVVSPAAPSPSSPAAEAPPSSTPSTAVEATEKPSPKPDARTSRTPERASSRADVVRQKPDQARKSTRPAAAPPATRATDSNPSREPSPQSATPVESPAADPPRAPETPPAPPEPQFVEVVVPASAVIGLQMDTTITTETARVEDRVQARVTRDVTESGRTAIPAGSRVIGSVTLVERGGKFKDRARLGVRFHTLVLADGREVPLRTDAIYRDGESPGSESSRKIGGAAVGGAILGAILGGGKGAMIGSAAGAGAGSAAVMAGDRNPAKLSSGEIVTVRLAAPASIEVDRDHQQ